MPTNPKARKTKPPKTAQQRMQARRKRLQAQGLRPVQHWVPDLRDPRVRAEIRREGALLAKHPENAAIDQWIEDIYDWSEWR
jgi:nicotinamide mononucleotide adenylyltransferase